MGLNRSRAHVHLRPEQDLWVICPFSEVNLENMKSEVSDASRKTHKLSQLSTRCSVLHCSHADSSVHG